MSTIVGQVPPPDGEALPGWDLRPLFPGLGSREYRASREALSAELAELAELYDLHDVRAQPAREVTAADRAALEAVLAATNEVLERVQALEGYVAALVAADASDEPAAAEEAGLQAELVGLGLLQVRLDGWVGCLGAAALVGEGRPDRAGHRGGQAAAHTYVLQRAEVAARHLMSEVEEDLLGQLRLSGGTAWQRLSGDLTARLTGTLDGQELPIAVLRGLATDPDRARREAAYRAEVAAWESVAVPLAACLNGIKGEAVTVNARRGWPDALTPALWANGVEPRALSAMQAASRAAFPEFRRFLRAKARLHAPGGAGLAWWDLLAPVPGERPLSWERAVEAVEDAFDSFGPGLAGLARRAFGERWVDAAARRGKRSGAFCIPVRGAESRIHLGFDGSWDGASTLAHELGHAYHNANLARRPPLQRQTPMALAETASTFCEGLLVEARLGRSGPDERLALLNLDLTGACQVVVDIHSRFLFEASVFERRSRGPLPADQLCELMGDAQHETYGDGLDASTRHRYMWAAKPHYYGVDAHFYNWPYCFGLLFGLGLLGRWREDPARFRVAYDDLLASTGTASPAELAARFDIDISSEAFWASSLEVLRARIDDFVSLVAQRG